MIFVSEKTATILKDKGFRDNCIMRYEEGKRILNEGWKCYNGKGGLDAPTTSQVLRWLREVHNIHVEVMFNTERKKDPVFVLYIINMSEQRHYIYKSERHKVFDYAVMAAIDYIITEII